MTPHVDTPSRVLSLFSGIGGLDLGIRGVFPGARVVCQVEREVYAARVLAARMEDGGLDPAPIWSDVTTFDAGAWRGRCDAVTAGFPCPPVSVAGKQAGNEDDRWLWPEVVRVFRESGARWLLLENVRGLLSANAGREFAEVLGNLARLGCAAEWAVVSASDVGASHRRERVFILACRMADSQDADRRSRGEGGEGGEGIGRGGSGGAGATLADADIARSKGRVESVERGKDERAAWESGTALELPTFPPGPGALDAWARILAVRPDLAPALTAEEETQLENGRVVDGLPTRVAPPSRADALRALGNAVIPAQAEAAFLELYRRMTE